MPRRETYIVSLISDLRYDERRHGVAFLECAEDASLDAKTYFERLKEKKQGDVLNRFQYWMDGGVFDNYFHGFPNDPKHKECFVFRWSQGPTHHRLYGFLIHPRLADPGYLACMLVSHAQKNTFNTDPNELDGAEELRTEAKVVAAVRKTKFRDPPRGA